MEGNVAVTPKVRVGPAYPKSFNISHLYLKEGEVSEDLHIFVVPLEGIAVTLDSLLVLLVRSLQ